MKSDNANRSPADSLLLYAVTDRMWTKEHSLIEQIKEAVKGGITCLQLREKELDGEAFLKEALEVKALCSACHIPLIINDNVDVALKCGADGIHIGQHDAALSEVRSLVGEKMWIGVSAQTVEQAVAAEQGGADYLGVGAMFSTSTKPDARPVSFETLREICQTVSIPVVAIGGIQKSNIRQLSGIGIAGAALVSAIFSAADIEQECRELRGLLSDCVSKKKPLKGIIFDADGTLLDSMGIWDELGSRYLHAHGITPGHELSEILFSMSIGEGCAYLKSVYSLQETVGQIQSDLLRIMTDFYRFEVPAKPGVYEFLHHIHKQGIPMSVATTNERQLLTAAFRRLGILDLFSHIYTCGELKTNKRDSLIYRTAAAAFDAEPDEVLVFEDSLFALQTAKRAGFSTVGVADAASARDKEQIIAEADFYIPDFSGFLQEHPCFL